MKIYYESKPGELEHGILSKVFKPKYLKKVPNGNGGYRYLYTQEEVDAYLKAQERSEKRQANIAAKRNKAYDDGALDAIMRTPVFGEPRIEYEAGKGFRVIPKEEREQKKKAREARYKNYNKK